MLKSTAPFLYLIILLLGSANTYADKSTEIALLLERTGLTKQVADLPAQFSQGVSQGIAQSGGPAEIGELIITSIGDGLSPERFVTNLTAAIDGGMSLTEIQTVNNWYTSDLAQKVTALEVTASTSEQNAYVMQNLDTLLADHERVAMARRVEEVIGGSEMALTMMSSMQTAMVNAMMVNAPAEQRQMVLDQMAQQIEMAMPQINEMMLATYVSTYSSLSDVEFDSYVEFLGTPEAVKFYRVTVDAMGATIGSAIANVIPALEQHMQ